MDLKSNGGLIMSNSLRKLLVLMCLITILSACSDKNESDNQEQNNMNTEESNVDNVNKDFSGNFQYELPTTIEEIIKYPVGPFGSKDVSIEDEELQKVLSEIPPLREDASEEELNELFAYLYSLFKLEYQDPRSMISSYAVNEKDSPETPNTKEQKRSFNVEIILDSSGSMGNYMGGKTRMELAKESIQQFASSLPEEANVSLRVYGHKGTGKESDKVMSCASSELIYPLQPYNKETMVQALNSFQPAGWTPLAASLIKAQEDLAPFKGENNRNIVYVVSDGIETCGGDPIAAANSLKESGVAPIVHVIGFDLNEKDQKQLQEIAKAAGGTYTNVKNQNQLQNEFNKTVQDSFEWLTWKVQETDMVITHKVNQTDEIYSVFSDWYDKNVHEKLIINSALVNLRANNIITENQKLELMKLKNNFFDNQQKKADELKKELLDTTMEEYQDKKNQIEEIYKKNISN